MPLRGILGHAKLLFLCDVNLVVNADVDELLFGHGGAAIGDLMDRHGLDFCHDTGQWIKTIRITEAVGSTRAMAGASGQWSGHGTLPRRRLSALRRDHDRLAHATGAEHHRHVPAAHRHRSPSDHGTEFWSDCER